MRTDLFAPNSRYYSTPTGKLVAPDGTKIVYLRRRFVPQPESFVTVLEHVVIEGERLDNITAQYIDDPEQFWRLCDANNAMRPAELTDIPGRTIRITLPEGIPAQQNV
jgi:hypothetical protein